LATDLVLVADRGSVKPRRDPMPHSVAPGTTPRFGSCAPALLVVLALVVTQPITARALPGEVLSHQKISATEGGFTGQLDDNDRLSIQISTLGDFDGDQVVDLAVGAALDDDGGPDRGAVWLMFLNGDGTVKEHRKISSTEGGFAGPLDDLDRFCRVASLGDVDGDRITDLAVGAHSDDDGGVDRGAVWILFLNSDGTVKAHQKISDTEGGFTGILDDGDNFAWSAATLLDLDADGIRDLAVGAPRDDDGGVDRGAVWILFLNSDGTVKAHQKISDTEGRFTGTLDDLDLFGHGVAPLGDLDQDGVVDLAVSAFYDDDGGPDRGAVWVLLLNSDGTVKAHQKISSTEGGFTGVLDDGDLFSRVTSLADVDGDGVQDLAVGAVDDDDGGPDRGAVWILFLNRDGTVRGHQKISSTEGRFAGVLGTLDKFGWSGAWLGDLDDDGRGDLAVGALWDDDGGLDRGAVWILFLDGTTVSVVSGLASPQIGFLANHPNPFTAQTSLEYALPTAASVRLLIYGPTGRRVATLVDRVQAAGSYSATWDGRDDVGSEVTAGTYFCRLEAGGFHQVRRMVLIR
jgi:hypothetical protein